MSGGIVQLVATGAQDTWLTGKPEVSFYRSSYKRYTHYARSFERQLIQGNPTAGNISTIRFEKKGDLVNVIYLIAKDSTGALIPGIDWTQVIDKIELLIGGQIVDTQDINWMTKIEPVTGAQNYSTRYLNNNTAGPKNTTAGFLPLKFFFCKDWNVSLPLVALQYHDVELRITWNTSLNTNTLTLTGLPNSGTAGNYGTFQYEAWANFIYLDQAEREYFANTPMDMLFTQVNRIAIGTNNMQELALAHPVKFLAFSTNNYSTAYTLSATNIPAINYQFKTQINGVDVGDSRSTLQWIDVPQYYFTPYGYVHNQSTANVALISYCLDTSKLQPTGTLNFSRIDTYRIVAPAGVSLSTLSGANGNYFYAVNYNVLRIKDGMAGQLYSN
jgi:Major capsid protein N-terminus/Large eukaryotic DNA virus major capsid protein